MCESIKDEDFGEELINAGFNMLDINKLDKESILEEKVFITIFNTTNNLERTKLIINLQKKAKELGILRNFDKLLKAYQQDYVQEKKRTKSNEAIEFEELKIGKISPGEWIVDYFGVYKYKMINYERIKIIACSHPILPIERLINVDTSTEKIKLAFYKDKKWQYVVVEKNTIASKSKILQLANRGIEVNENNAKELITYLSDIINLNIDKIPYSESITHLGWIDKDEFVPYTDKYKYDGDVSYQTLFEAVSSNGSYDEWKRYIKELRKKSAPLRFIMASSFASVLVKIFKINPFIVHLWGKSSNGKTVAQMIGASIWGNPLRGKLLTSLDDSKVASERKLNFLRHLPLIPDELQLIKNTSNFDTLVYVLTEGKGKDRGTIDNGLTNVTEWDNIIITSGEEPMTNPMSKEGVKNRVFEIEENSTIVEDGREVVSFIQNNYGYAGKEFVEIIKNENNLFEKYNEIIKKLKNITKSKKQMNAMGIVLLADKIVSEKIFKDECLKIKEISNYFTKDIDEADRIYNLIIDWFYQNINKFYYDSNITNGEIWGNYEKAEDKITEIYIIPKVLKEFLSSNNISFDGIKQKLFDNGYIEKNVTEKRVAYTFSRRINGTVCQCIKIVQKCLEKENKEQEIEDEPF